MATSVIIGPLVVFLVLVASCLLIEKGAKKEAAKECRNKGKAAKGQREKEKKRILLQLAFH